MSVSPIIVLQLKLTFFDTSISDKQPVLSQNIVLFINK